MIPGAQVCTTSEQPDASPCEGNVETFRSRSGMTTTLRCWGHQREHEERLDEIAHRYPDSDVPPAWFDPLFAGESWNSDY